MAVLAEADRLLRVVRRPSLTGHNRTVFSVARVAGKRTLQKASSADRGELLFLLVAALSGRPPSIPGQAHVISARQKPRGIAWHARRGMPR
jgi:hypothetical protein